ncbi:MAG: TniQ family protein [Streptosporangiaceae bacterium]
MPPPQPLGRSLVPIPGESLPGFLLRLSFRLNLTPARLAELTGLAPDGRSTSSLPVALLTRIPDPGRHLFAHMTRLTGGQVTGLGLASRQERYPLPAWMPGKRHSLPADRWSLFAPATRYCPECLAGDGSAIQESFGGPWLKAWHLPVVFACPAHQRLLEHHCPGCGHAVHVGPGTHASYALLPKTQMAGLHPAQCRADPAPGRNDRTPAECCGARLDQAGSRRQASPGLLAFQDKIFSLLDPDGPASTASAGMPASPGSYFADLRALGLLAYSTWPAVRHLSPSGEIAAAIDQHVASLRQQEAERQASSPASIARTVPPPLDAAVSAGLAHIADRILAGTPDEVRGQLRLLLPSTTREAGRTNWARWVTLSAVPCSAGLQAAYDPLLRRFTTPFGQPRGRASTVLRAARWGPGNVPALIPEDWYARHFTPIAGVSPILARRTAALRLVQMVAGGSLAEAARFLGIASGDGSWPREGGRVYSSAGIVHSGARQQPDPFGFEAGLRSLARELSAPDTPLTNYQRRRQALETWSIDEPTWNSLADRLPSISRPQTSELGDRKRQIASVYIWVRVTSGEPTSAPRPIEAAQPPDVQEGWRRSRNAIWWSLLTSNNIRAAYTHLRTELDALAATLATTVDPSHRHDSPLGTVALYVSRHPRRPRRPRTPDDYTE